MATQSQESRRSAETRGTPLGRLDALVFAAGFAVPFLVYLATLMPSVAGGDSGELTAAARVLGVAHAPGYPLYTLLLHAWQWLPIGSVAYRSNLFSAVTMAGMCAALAWVYRMAGGSRPGALLAAFVPAFLSITWNLATRTEVYGLHALLVALTLGLFLRWDRLRTDRSLVWLALLAGFTLAHHRTSLFVVLPFLAVALLRHRPWTVGRAVKVAVALVAPFAVYAYLPLRAAANPPMNWGDIRSWSEFVYHAMGRRATIWIFMRPWQEWVTFFLGGAIVIPAAQMSAVGVGLVALGAAAVVVRRRAAGLCALAGVLLLGGWSSSWGWGEAKWFIPVFMFYGLWLAAGVEVVAAGVRRLAPQAGSALAATVRVAAAVAFPLLLLSNNFAAKNHSRDWGPYDWGRTLMAEVEPNALVALSGDTPLMIARYLQVVEQARPDLEIIGPTLLAEPWAQRQLRDPATKRLVEAALLTNPATTPEEWAQHLMRHIVWQYADSRPVHYNRPLTDLGPGYRTMEYQTVYRFTADGPALLKPDAPGLAMYTESVFGQVTYAHLPQLALRRAVGAAPLGSGVVLLRAEPEPAAVAAGEVFRVRYQWRCEESVGKALSLKVDFVNAQWLLAQNDPAVVPPPAARLAFGVEQALLYGVIPLEPNAPGTHYEETAHYVAAHDVPPGPYLMRVAIASDAGAGASLPVAVARVDVEAAP